MSSSRSERHSAQRAFRRLPLLVIALLLMIVPPTVAWAGQINYASGTNGVGGTFPTSGEAVRSYNQVWHQSGYYWWVWYLHGSSQTGLVYDNANPTKILFCPTTCAAAGADTGGKLEVAVGCKAPPPK